MTKVRHTRNQQSGQTGQGSHRSRTTCLQDSCGSSLFCVFRGCSGGSTRVEQAQAGYVIMFADMSLLAGLAAPVTLISWRSHLVKRVVASASAAEAMGLSEAIAQGDWVRSLREWRERTDVPPLISVTDSKGNYDHLHNETIGPSEDRRSAIDLAIIREDFRPQMFLRWVDGKAQVADAWMAMEICCELCAVKHSRCWSRHQRLWLPDVKKGENVKGYRESIRLREPVDETSIPVTPTPTVT